MKKHLKILIMMLGFNVYSQVGIGTESPTRTLHVEGNTIIRNLAFKASDSDYTKVLVTDDKGNIDYINKSSILPTKDGSIDKVILNNEFTTPNSTPDATKTLKCGKFEFAFVPNSGTGDVRFRLINAPVTGTTVKVYTTFEQNYETNGFQYQAKSTPKEFTSTNNFIDVPFDGQARIEDGEYNELYLSYPKEPDFYRVSFYRLYQSGKNYWISTCEKF